MIEPTPSSTSASRASRARISFTVWRDSETISASSLLSASSGAELAKKLPNPVASLIRVPFQSNFDFGGGFDDDGFRYTLNVQPVIPIALSEHWN